MTWTVVLTRRAERRLQQVRGADLERLIAAIDQMAEAPHLGDTKALKGKHTGLYRRRVGNWRIIFTIDDGILVVQVIDIVRHSSTTYS